MALRPVQRSAKCLPRLFITGLFYFCFGQIHLCWFVNLMNLSIFWVRLALLFLTPVCVYVSVCVFVFLAEATIGSICIPAWLWRPLCNWRFEHFSPDVPIPESRLIWETYLISVSVFKLGPLCVLILQVCKRIPACVRSMTACWCCARTCVCVCACLSPSSLTIHSLFSPPFFLLGSIKRLGLIFQQSVG